MLYGPTKKRARARARVYVRVVLPRTMYQCTKHRVRVNAARGVACARARCIFFFHPSTNERTNVTSGRVINQNPMQRRQRPPIKRRSLLKRLVTNPRSCNAARSLSLTHTQIPHPAALSTLSPCPPRPRARVYIFIHGAPAFAGSTSIVPERHAAGHASRLQFRLKHETR